MPFVQHIHVPSVRFGGAHTKLSFGDVIAAEKKIDHRVFGGAGLERWSMDAAALPHNVRIHIKGFDKTDAYKIPLHQLLGPTGPSDILYAVHLQNPSAKVDCMWLYDATGKRVATGQVSDDYPMNDGFSWSIQADHVRRDG